MQHVYTIFLHVQLTAGAKQAICIDLIAPPKFCPKLGDARLCDTKQQQCAPTRSISRERDSNETSLLLVKCGEMNMMQMDMLRGAERVIQLDKFGLSKLISSSSDLPWLLVTPLRELLCKIWAQVSAESPEFDLQSDTHFRLSPRRKAPVQQFPTVTWQMMFVMANVRGIWWTCTRSCFLLAVTVNWTCLIKIHDGFSRPLLSLFASARISAKRRLPWNGHPFSSRSGLKNRVKTEKEMVLF